MLRTALVVILTAAPAPAPAPTPAAETPVCPPALELVTLDVNGANDEWTATALSVEAGDMVTIEANGVVKIGAWAGSTNADGIANGDNYGRLHLKIGDGAPVKAGQRFVLTATSGGVLKFRVNDSKHGDNEGAYSVRAVRIPAKAIPPARH